MKVQNEVEGGLLLNVIVRSSWAACQWKLSVAGREECSSCRGSWPWRCRLCRKTRLRELSSCPWGSWRRSACHCGDGGQPGGWTPSEYCNQKGCGRPCPQPPNRRHSWWEGWRFHDDRRMWRLLQWIPRAPSVTTIPLPNAYHQRRIREPSEDKLISCTCSGQQRYSKASTYRWVLNWKPEWLGKATRSIGWSLMHQQSEKARKQIESRGFPERRWGASGRCSTAQGQSDEGSDLESSRVRNLHNLQFSCVNSSK